MQKINSCPICNSTDVVYKPALIARFVNWRITGKLEKAETPSESIKCNTCNFFGCRDRISEEESKKLYLKYRDDAYSNMRVECEPNYLERQLSFDENSYTQERFNNLTNLVYKHLDTKNILSILDYGGDDGRYSKIFDNAEKYVYDVAQNQLVDGVSFFDLNEHRTFDFIMCCHVLEHLSELNDVVAKIKSFAHKDTYFYIEVPGYSNPPPELPIFHEHINIFNIDSLKSLLHRNDIVMIDYTFDGKYNCVVGKCK
jgi:hypothetical protein